jgi:hypothetical protein
MRYLSPATAFALVNGSRVNARAFAAQPVAIVEIH